MFDARNWVRLREEACPNSNPSIEQRVVLNRRTIRQTDQRLKFEVGCAFPGILGRITAWVLMYNVCTFWLISVNN